MKNKLLVIGVILFVFGLFNLLWVFSIHGLDTFLLFPFAFEKSGMATIPFTSIPQCSVDCNLIENIYNRLSAGNQNHSVIENFTFSYGELIWSFSLYFGISSIVIWRIRK